MSIHINARKTIVYECYFNQKIFKNKKKQSNENLMVSILVATLQCRISTIIYNNKTCCTRCFIIIGIFDLIKNTMTF